MPSINSIGNAQIKAALFGFVQNRRKNSPGIAGLIEGASEAKLLETISNSSTRRRRQPIRANLAVADRLEVLSNFSSIGAQNAELGALRQSTADAGLSSANDALGRMQELAASASNPFLSDGDRAALNAEAQALKQEISDIQSNTKHNGSPVLAGSATSTYTGESNVTLNDGDLSTVNADIAAIDLSTRAGADSAITNLNTARDNLSLERARVGANHNRLTRASDMATSAAQNQQQSADNIRDSELGALGSLLGEELSAILTELIGFQF